LSYLGDLSRIEAMEIMALFPFSTTIVVVSKGIPLAMTMSLAFYMEKVKHAQAPWDNSFFLKRSI